MTSDDAFWADALRLRRREFGRDDGLSDQALTCERRAQAIFFPALEGFQSRVREASALSGLMERQFRYLLDALDDHAPTRNGWDERIGEELL